MSSLILHLDMDAFFASVEQAIDPRLKGRPVIVGSRPGRFTTVVCAASYEAKAYGIDSGMRTHEALRRCPHAAFVVADPSRYLYTARVIRQALFRYSPDVQMPSIDEFNVLLSGPDISLKKACDIGEDARRHIQDMFGITASAGIAPQRIIAKLLAKRAKPDGLSFWDAASMRRFLPEVPAGELCGVGKHLKEYLDSIGVLTCGQVTEQGEHFWKERLGKKGVWLFYVCQGEETSESLPGPFDEGPKSVGHSITLRCATDSPLVISRWLRTLSEMIGVRLRRVRCQGKCVHVLLWGRTNSFCRQRRFPLATADGERIFRRACDISAPVLVGRAFVVRGLGVSVSALESLSSDFLFPCDARRWRCIETQDRVNSRFGHWSLYPASLLPSKEEQFR